MKWLRLWRLSKPALMSELCEEIDRCACAEQKCKELQANVRVLKAEVWRLERELADFHRMQRSAEDDALEAELRLLLRLEGE